MKVFDYRCPSCDRKFEAFVHSDDHEIRCSCGTKAKRVVGATKMYLDPISGDFPGATAKWVREHEKAGKVKDAP